MRKSIIISALLLCFACEEEMAPPEIWLDISPVYVGIRSTDAGPYHFDLQFSNRGEELLELSGFRVKGDRNCAFEFQGPDINEVAAGGSAFVRGWYQPRVVADDQIALEMNSNSHINPKLVIPVCGRCVYPGTMDAGPPPACNVPPSDQPDCAR